ncbi:uncharacterized protein K02A2.6-like [Eupeodes corollae]|uniref:uncharacterized protein K02A2.6-like n=1 Tax=Eupeodes corollae TaxID=290404 RepID=UPI00249334A8|nr:uncharacterized protein K02A2.6-like [Eupeodes corollae]
MYASRALTFTEQRYTQMEKECLAILFSCKRFDKYVCGEDEIIVQTDHKPLLTIFNKDLMKASRRIQRMLLSLQRYHIILNYVEGKHMYIADLLSRYVDYTENSPEKSVYEEEVYKIDKVFNEISEFNITTEVDLDDIQIEDIRNKTANDNVLKENCIRGWPENNKDLPIELLPYWSFRDEIVSQKGILIKSNRIIIPTILRKDIIKRIHLGHPGRDQCYRRAHDSVFWPGINDHIKQEISACAKCAENADNQQKQPLETTEIPKLPFERVAIDIC